MLKKIVFQYITMGIDYEPAVIYGMCFSYEEAQVLKNLQETKDLADEIGTDNLINLWGEELYIIEGEYKITLIVQHPWFDACENDCLYYIGVCLTNKNIQYIKNLKEEEVNEEILDICKYYMLNSKEIKIHYDVNVW